MDERDNQILTEIAEFCSSCESSNCCPEDDCVLFRIEKIVTGEADISETDKQDETDL